MRASVGGFLYSNNLKEIKEVFVYCKYFFLQVLFWMSVVSCKPFPCNFSANFLSAVNVVSYSCTVCKAEAGSDCLSWTSLGCNNIVYTVFKVY